MREKHWTGIWWWRKTLPEKSEKAFRKPGGTDEKSKKHKKNEQTLDNPKRA